MFNYITAAIGDLKDFEKQKQGIESTKKRIKALELKCLEMKSIQTDRESKGNLTVQEAIDNNFAERDRLGYALSAAEVLTELTENGLAILTDEEFLILDRFYIHPEKNCVNSLCAELNIEQATLYRRRKEALRKFALAEYGIIEM